MRRLALVAILGMLACTATRPRGDGTTPTRTSGAPAQATRAAVRADLDIRLLARNRLSYVASTFGPNATFVGIALTNRSSAPISLPSVRATFTALRDGVAFACDDSSVSRDRDPDADREAQVLAPGESFTYRRALGCRMPITGNYVVRVKLALGDAPPADAGEVTIAVEARGKVPLEHPDVPGLFGLISGDTAARPQGTTPGYAVVILLVNASARSITLEHPNVLFRVSRVGSRIPCMGEAVPLDVSVLAPGAIHVRRVPVTCVLHEPGNYSVEGALVLDQKREGPLGRVRLAISKDPLLFSAPRAY